MKKFSQGTSGLYLAGAGLIFLANGNCNIIDILPDFIGYLLILAGIWRLSYASPGFARSRKHLWLLAALNAAKLLASLFTGGLGNDSLLLMTAVFAVAEAVPLYGFVRSLFAGLDELSGMAGYKYEAELRRVRAFSYIFLGFKFAANLLPELITLTGSERYGTVYLTPRLTLLEAKPSIALVSAAAATLMGVAWLSMALPFLRRLARDGELFSEANLKISASMAANGAHIRERRCAAAVLALIALPFLTDLTFDGVNVLPTFVCALLAGAAFGLLRSVSGRRANNSAAAPFAAAFLIAAGGYALSAVNNAAYTDAVLSGRYTSALLYASAAAYIAALIPLFFAFRALFALFAEAAPDLPGGRSPHLAGVCIAGFMLLKFARVLLPVDGIVYLFSTLLLISALAGTAVWLSKFLRNMKSIGTGK